MKIAGNVMQCVCSVKLGKSAGKETISKMVAG